MRRRTPARCPRSLHGPLRYSGLPADRRSQSTVAPWRPQHSVPEPPTHPLTERRFARSSRGSVAPSSTSSTGRRGPRGGAVRRPRRRAVARRGARGLRRARSWQGWVAPPMVDRWRRSSRSKSPSTAQNLSVSLVSGARCWGTSYRRHRRGLPLGTISIARCRRSIRVQGSHALIPQGWARDCSSSAFPKARSSRIGCILTCGSAPGSWVKSAWPHLRPNAHDWSRSAPYACDYCVPMAATSRAS